MVKSTFTLLSRYGPVICSMGNGNLVNGRKKEERDEKRSNSKIIQLYQGLKLFSSLPPAALSPLPTHTLVFPSLYSPVTFSMENGCSGAKHQSCNHLLCV